MADVHDATQDVDRYGARARRELERSLDVPAPSFAALHRRRERRHHLTGVAVVALFGILGVVAVTVQDRGDGGREVTAGPPEHAIEANADLLDAGQVRALAPSPLEGRSTMASVWTGTEVLIWGGDGTNGPFDDGAGYDTRTDTWRVLPDGPLSARNAPAAVWTGTEMILWGGHGAGRDHVDGAAFDPATDTWRPIADGPMSSQGRPTAVWTGEVMIVLAGFNGRDAAAYDPATDTWRTLADAPGAPSAPDPQVVWTGRHLVARLSHPMALRSGLYSYDPTEDRWQELPALEGAGETSMILAWTGDRLLAASYRSVAASYDFTTGAWTTVAGWPSALGPPDASAWTGEALFVWSGTGGAALEPDGTWTGTPVEEPAAERTQPAAVWADGVFILWGGFPGRADGLMIRPWAPSPGPSETASLPAPLPPPSPSTHEPDLVPVVDSSGTTRGTIDQNGPPATWNDTTLPLLPVEDDDGNLVGYFGCRFFERSEVEHDDFDPDCPGVTTTTG